jgi:hypothetical protein
MHLPPGSELWLLGLMAFGVCLAILNAVTRRVPPPSYDDLEQTGVVNGIRARRRSRRIPGAFS